MLDRERERMSGLLGLRLAEFRFTWVVDGAPLSLRFQELPSWSLLSRLPIKLLLVQNLLGPLFHDALLQIPLRNSLHLLLFLHDVNLAPLFILLLPLQELEWLAHVDQRHHPQHDQHTNHHCPHRIDQVHVDASVLDSRICAYFLIVLAD